MGHDELIITLRIFGAVAIGGLIGFERTFHGRPAGFRTHALVCVASALLMMVTVHQGQWMHVVAIGNIQTDPTRMAQGIMFECRMVLRSRDPRSAETLSQHLRKLPEVIEFRISPTGD